MTSRVASTTSGPMPSPRMRVTARVVLIGRVSRRTGPAPSGLAPFPGEGRRLRPRLLLLRLHDRALRMLEHVHADHLVVDVARQGPEVHGNGPLLDLALGVLAAEDVLHDRAGD